MLVELMMVEQRYQDVREVLGTGASVTDVATRYGVDRRTLHRWLIRYANEGLAATKCRKNPARATARSVPDACLIVAPLLLDRWFQHDALAASLNV